MDDIQFELIDVFLELFPSGDASGGKLVHGFLLDVGMSEGFFEICFESDESPKGLVAKPCWW